MIQMHVSAVVIFTKTVNYFKVENSILIRLRLMSHLDTRYKKPVQQYFTVFLLSTLIDTGAYWLLVL